MPCQSGSGPYTVYRDNPEVVALLCSACRSLARLGYDFGENPELDRWWTEHQKEDEQRRFEEKRKQVRRNIALALTEVPIKQLTPDDKKLLREEGLL